MTMYYMLIRGGPSHLVELHDDKVWELDSASTSIPEALALLAKMVGGSTIVPGVNCRDIFAKPSRPSTPSGMTFISYRM